MTATPEGTLNEKTGWYEVVLEEYDGPKLSYKTGLEYVPGGCAMIARSEEQHETGGHAYNVVVLGSQGMRELIRVYTAAMLLPLRPPRPQIARSTKEAEHEVDHRPTAPLRP